MSAPASPTSPSGTPAVPTTDLPGRASPVSIILLLILGSVWGLTLSIAKIASGAGVPPLGYAFWQGAGAGLVLLAICAATGRLPPVDRPHLRYYVFMGACGLGIPNAISFTVITQVPVGAMAVVINLVPLIVYTLSLILGLERFAALRFTGVVVGLAGALSLVLPEASLPDPAMTGWLVLGMATPTLYAIGAIGGARWRPAGTPSLTLASGMLLAAGLVLLPVVLATGTFYVPRIGLGGSPPPGTGDAALAAQIGASSMMFVLYFELLRRSGPLIASLVGYLVTLSGILWGMAIFGERHSAWLWLAVALIFAGLGLVNFAGRRSRPSTAP